MDLESIFLTCVMTRPDVGLGQGQASRRPARPAVGPIWVRDNIFPEQDSFIARELAMFDFKEVRCYKVHTVDLKLRYFLGRVNMVLKLRLQPHAHGQLAMQINGDLTNRIE